MELELSPSPEELLEDSALLSELSVPELSDELTSLLLESGGAEESLEPVDRLDSELALLSTSDDSDPVLPLAALLAELSDSKLSDELNSLLDAALADEVADSLAADDELLSLDEDSESELSPSLDDDSELSDELLGVEELLSLEDDSPLDSELELLSLLESELAGDSELADEVDDSLESEGTLLSLSELLDSELPEELLMLESELESEPVLKSSGTMAAMANASGEAALAVVL